MANFWLDRENTGKLAVVDMIQSMEIRRRAPNQPLTKLLSYYFWKTAKFNGRQHGVSIWFSVTIHSLSNNLVHSDRGLIVVFLYHFRML